MPRSGSPLIPLRLERRSHWPRPESRSQWSLLTVLLVLGFVAVAAALGTSTAWTSVSGANPWQWRGIASHFLPLILITFLLEWALLSRDRVGSRVALTAIPLATLLAVRTMASARARIDPIDFAMGLFGPIAMYLTAGAIFGVARWAGWRWVWKENPSGTDDSRPPE